MWKVPSPEIETCAAMLEGFAGREKDQVDRLIARAQPTVSQLAGGQLLLPEIRKLLRAGNGARAAVLLRNHSRWRRIPGSQFIPQKLRAFLWVPLALVILPVASYVMPRCNGGFELAMEDLNACAAAREALGSPIELAPIGMSCGSSETRGHGFGHAQWSMRVAGPKKSATYSYAAESHGGRWHLVSAELSPDGGEDINIRACAPASSAGSDGRTDRLIAGAEWKGRVENVTGTSVVKKGELCLVQVSPAPERFRTRGYNCHAKVTCGSAVLYGWEGAGVTRCPAENGRVAAVVDDTGAREQDDPMLKVEPKRKRAVVSDNRPGSEYEVVIEIL